MRIIDAITEFDQAISALQSGGIIAHATETCYGFACDITNSEAVKRLFAIKKRSEDQPVSALFSSIEEAKRFVQWNDRAEELASKHLPGPLTLILPLLETPPVSIFPMPTGGATVGIRISSHPLPQNLVIEFGKPITTTSANLHGAMNPYSVEDIQEQYVNEKLQPDLILDCGKIPKTPPSTVINLSGEKEELLRG